MRQLRKKQLRHGLKYIERLEEYYAESPLTIAQVLALETIKELYRQKNIWMSIKP